MRRMFPAAGRRPRRVVFTCLFGYSEAFADTPYQPDGQTDFICFTDDRGLRSKTWTFRPYDPALLGPVRTAKMFKILPHRFLGDYDCSIYLDNTVQMVAPYPDIFGQLERSASPLMAFRHAARSCVYEEAQMVKSYGYDDAATIDVQMQHYRSIGHPENAGLIAGGYLVRRHNDAALATVMEQWFMQVCRYSYRDQLSLPVVARRLGFEPDYFPGMLTDKKTVLWPTQVAKKRLPRDFRDDIYLAIHEDVRSAGMNPREHYLKFGMAEGRRYKSE